MAGLRIGIDVGGTFTHGVVLRPPGSVIASARTPTTHSQAQGVAAGVQPVLRDLLGQLDAQGLQRSAVELVAHSTTQATNALLEGDVSPVTRIVLIPPGEDWLCRNTLKGARLDIGGGHGIALETQYVPWEAVAQASSQWPALAAGETPPLPSAVGAAPVAEAPGWQQAAGRPIAVIQPLAGGHELREHTVAEACRAAGRHRRLRQ